MLSDARITLHQIEPKREAAQAAAQQGGAAAAAAPGAQRRSFPEREDGQFAKATAMALTESFLIYGTAAGTVEFFDLEPADWSVLSGAELRHSTAIKALYPNYLGTRVVVVDASNQGACRARPCFFVHACFPPHASPVGCVGGGSVTSAHVAAAAATCADVTDPPRAPSPSCSHRTAAEQTKINVVSSRASVSAGLIYNPVSAELTPIPLFPANVTHVMWDTADRSVLHVFDGKELHTCVSRGRARAGARRRRSCERVRCVPPPPPATRRRRASALCEVPPATRRRAVSGLSIESEPLCVVSATQRARW